MLLCIYWLFIFERFMFLYCTYLKKKWDICLAPLCINNFNLGIVFFTFVLIFSFFYVYICHLPYELFLNISAILNISWSQDLIHFKRRWCWSWYLNVTSLFYFLLLENLENLNFVILWLRNIIKIVLILRKISV